MMPSINVQLYLGVALPLLLASCGHRYHLTGHREANLSHPPDIKVRVGESRLAVSCGLSLHLLAPSYARISIDDSSIAQIVTDGWEHAWIHGVAPGKTKASYGEQLDPNQGFWIIVTP